MMMIIEIDAGKQPKDLPEKAKQALINRKFQTAEPLMLGTQIVGGRQIVMIDSADLPIELEAFTNYIPEPEYDEDGKKIKKAKKDKTDKDYYKEDENGEVSEVEMDLLVLAVENEVVDQSLLLPYFVDVLVYDEDGEEIGTEPVTDLTGKLQVWAGRNWKY